MTGYDYYRLILGFVCAAALLLERVFHNLGGALVFEGAFGQLILIVLAAATAMDYGRRLFLSPVRVRWLRSHLIDTAASILIVAFAVFSIGTASSNSALPLIAAVAARSLILSVQRGGWRRELDIFLGGLASRPAATILTSFLAVIIIGAWALNLEGATQDGRGLPPVDALFTSVSAICVTGLSVIDVSSVLSLFGRVVLLSLIQIGGLGIMVVSYFLALVLRRRLGLAGALLVSYMTDEDNVAAAGRALRGIVIKTLAIEAAGTLLLFFAFLGDNKPASWTQDAFNAVFHAISAFCNAGFSLFSDSLEGFRHNSSVLFIIMSLIVLGSVGFTVIDELSGRVWRFFRRRPSGPLAPNTIVSLLVSLGLILGGAALIYALEHGRSMKAYDLGEQYLSALFQSVTLRTAGFNSMPINSLRDSTLLIMLVFMFVGGASGGTAGGIKVGTVAVLWAAVASFLKNRRTVRLGLWSIDETRVIRALIILVFGLGAVISAVFLLSLSDGQPFMSTLFECVSAFGTVGLSLGVTAGFSVLGKLLLCLLMFFGRLGPITILSAAAAKSEEAKLEYPNADISVG